MKLKSTALAALLLGTTYANAGVFFEAKGGLGIWMAESSGDMRYKSADKFSLSQLDIDKDSSTYLYASFEHFVPVVPNLKMQRHSFSDTGRATKTGQFGDTNIDIDAPTELSFTQTDFTLYWKVPGISLATAGIVDIDVGLTAKNFSGSSAKIGSEETTFNETVPLGYLGAQIDLPTLPIEFDLNTQYSSYKSSSIQDSSVMVSYTLPFSPILVDLRVDAGYKKQTIDIDSKLVSDTDIDIDTSGFFFGISAKF